MRGMRKRLIQLSSVGDGTNLELISAGYWVTCIWILNILDTIVRIEVL